jgi:hypothetical protein
MLRIYVNGTLEGTTAGVTTWDAPGTIEVGRGEAGMYLNGSASEIQLWSRLILDSEVFDMSDPFKVGRVGEWHFEEEGPGPATDSSGMAHDLTFFGGTQIPPNGAGHTGLGLRLDGVDDYAAPSEQVLHTDQSFTVAGWVRLSDTSRLQTLLSQRGTGPNHGFYLMYDPAGGGKWVFAMKDSATGTTGTFATLPATSLAGYHQLVGVFDAQRREMRLYVDGSQQVVVAMNSAWQPWDATGPMVIGAGPSTFLKADVDEIRTYQGAAIDVTSITGGNDALPMGKSLVTGLRPRSNDPRSSMLQR